MDRVSAVHFTHHTGLLVYIKQTIKVIPTASGLVHPLPTHSLTGDEGQSYKICLRGKPLSGGRARHCLLKAPFAQVQPPSRSETTDGSGLEVNIPFPLDKPCLHRDEWHEILPLGGWKGPGPTPGPTVAFARWAGRLLVHGTHTRSIPHTRSKPSGSPHEVLKELCHVSS